MEFSHESYRRLLRLLKEHNYSVSDYHNYEKYDKTAILRHDIDTSVKKAVEFARIENEEGVQATYFVLLSTDFYNVNSKETKKLLEEMQHLGGQIGLHFDETKYEINSVEKLVECILQEKNILELSLEVPISVVSMHRPSKWILDQKFEIPGMINSYSIEFFEKFKYVSDSRRKWREDVEAIITSGLYDKLHILTHAFWYDMCENTARQTLLSFIKSAKYERYRSLLGNIRDMGEFVREEDLKEL